jgi:hypothetical protein
MSLLLFLDIDGVLHPVATRPDQHLTHKPRFEQWAAGHPDLRIVITSSWRQRYPLAVLKGLFSPAISARVIGSTPRIYGAPAQRRYQEILAWLKKNDAMSLPWLALDDSPADFPPGCPHLVCCDAARGFDDEVARELDRCVKARTSPPQPGS